MCDCSGPVPSVFPLLLSITIHRDGSISIIIVYINHQLDYYYYDMTFSNETYICNVNS